MKIPTVRVVVKATGHEVTINESDFRADLHQHVHDSEASTPHGQSVAGGYVDFGAGTRTLLHYDQVIPRGDLGRLSETPVDVGKLASELIAHSAPVADAVPDANVETHPDIASLNALQAKALIGDADATLLDVFEAAEKANTSYEGGRKGVLAAIAERRAVLAGG